MFVCFFALGRILPPPRASIFFVTFDIPKEPLSATSKNEYNMDKLWHASALSRGEGGGCANKDNPLQVRNYKTNYPGGALIWGKQSAIHFLKHQKENVSPEVEWLDFMKYGLHIPGCFPTEQNRPFPKQNFSVFPHPFWTMGENRKRERTRNHSVSPSSFLLLVSCFFGDVEMFPTLVTRTSTCRSFAVNHCLTRKHSKLRKNQREW